VLADRRCRMPATDEASTQLSARYDVAISCMHFNAVIASLKSMRLWLGYRTNHGLARSQLANGVS